MGTPATYQVSLGRSRAVHAENRDFGRYDLHRPREHCEAVGHGDLLCTVRVVCNDAPTHRAAELLAEEPFTRGRIESIKIAAHIAKEHHPSGGRRYAGHHGII